MSTTLFQVPPAFATNANPWLPIETFPKKDGMVVDLWIPTYKIPDQNAHRGHRRVCGAHWIYGKWMHRYERDEYLKTATHWMPEPPQPNPEPKP